MTIRRHTFGVRNSLCWNFVATYGWTCMLTSTRANKQISAYHVQIVIWYGQIMCKGNTWQSWVEKYLYLSTWYLQVLFEVLVLVLKYIWFFNKVLVLVLKYNRKVLEKASTNSSTFKKTYDRKSVFINTFKKKMIKYYNGFHISILNIYVLPIRSTVLIHNLNIINYIQTGINILFLMMSLHRTKLHHFTMMWMII